MKAKKVLVITAIAISIALIIIFANTSTYTLISSDVDIDLVKFNSVEFDEDCAKAYDLLLHANSFSTGPIGVAASIPDEIHAFGKLLICNNAKDLFLQLEQKATIAGKMYALCGLYYVDHENYDTFMEKYHSNTSLITTIDGCIGFERPVHELIKSDFAVRLESRNDTVRKYLIRNRLAVCVTDFCDGGTPNSVLYATGLGRYEIETHGIEIFGFDIQL